MPRRDAHEDDDDESSWGETEFDADPCDEEDDATIPCPYCRRDIHEDAQRCPYCENYVSDEDAPNAPKPRWIIIVVVLVCLSLIYLTLFH